MVPDYRERVRHVNGVVVGLDIGGTTTKVVGFRKGELLLETLVKASDPVASAYGALGKFLRENDLRLSEIEQICATGVGASYLDGELFECPTRIVPEFDAIGLGGLYAAGVEKAVVVSLGTGTSIVSADESGTQHLIGSGVGGGTVLGLSDKMLHVRDFTTISAMAELGDIERIDLSIGDISRADIPGLSSDTTASNFGKADEGATPEDLARGIVNLVFQSVGTASVLCARLVGTETIVFTGNLIRVAEGRRTLSAFSTLYNVRMLMPAHAEFATAIGAALLYD